MLTSETVRPWRAAAADTMRAAAAKMRERAEQAGEGVWLPDGEYLETPTLDVRFADHHHLVPHVASWDPVVARATADLMDAGADEFDRREEKWGLMSLDGANPTADALVHLARTYLGEA